MEFKVKLTKEEEEDLLAKARDEVRDELTEEAIIKHLTNNTSLPILEYLSQFNIYKKMEDLNDTKIGDLTKNEKMILVLAWMLYERLD